MPEVAYLNKAKKHGSQLEKTQEKHASTSFSIRQELNIMLARTEIEENERQMNLGLPLFFFFLINEIKQKWKILHD